MCGKTREGRHEKQYINTRNGVGRGSDKVNGRKFLEEVLKERSKTKWMRLIKSKDVIVVGFHNKAEKTKIWKNKHKLKGSNIFIDDDLMKEETIR